MTVAAFAPAPGAGPWLDFARLELGARPNQALACAAELCPLARASRPPIMLDADPQRVAAALVRLEPRAEFRTEENGSIRTRYVAVTPIMRFRDDVDILIAPTPEGRSMVAVYSRSRIGYSDLGANRARIERLERRLQTELAR